MRSLLYWVGLVLFWIIKEGEMPNQKVVLFIMPFYLLWLLLMIICVLRTGRAMKIFWIGNLRDPDTLAMPNLPYALTFIVGCIVILWIQWRYWEWYWRQ